MKVNFLSSWLAVCALGVLISCGTPGAPKPPSLELPRRVDNLGATRKGDQVRLTWTLPSRTTDGTRIKHLGVTRICRGVEMLTMVQCVEEVGTLAAAQLPASGSAVYIDVLPQELQQRQLLGFASYAVETENDRGRSAGLSNQVVVPLAPTLPPPRDLEARVTPEGVELTWTGALHEHDPQNKLRHFYRVYRHAEGASAESVAGEVRLGTGFQGELLDRGAEWEQRYRYKVTAVTVEPVLGQEEQIEGADSAVVEVFVHDVFPPATPGGVQAVFSGLPQQLFIDLTWAPNTEADLAGYNVYRHQQGRPPVKVNPELVKTPAFRDPDVQPGQEYFYSVTAVDLRGNESGHSREASEVVPKETADIFPPRIRCGI